MIEAAHGRLSGLVDALTGSFIPPELERAGPRERRRTRLLLAICLNLLLWNPLSSALFVFGFHEPLPARFLTMAGLLALLSPWILRETGSIALSGHWLCAQFFWCNLVLAALTGGSTSPALLWLVVVPTLAGMMMGRRAALIWTGLVCAAISGFYVMELRSVALFEVITTPQLALLQALGLCGVAVLMVTAGLLSERQVGTTLDQLAAANRELLQARDEAQSHSQAKSAFLATMSHELRTPMNAIIGMTDMMMRSGLNEVQLEYARATLNGSEDLLGLINDILSFSVLDSQALELECTDFVLEDALEEVLAPARPRAARKGIARRTEIGPGVPAAIHADAERLRQVLSSLLSNAVKFTEEGWVQIRVRCSQRSGDPITLTFEVQDTGIGVPDEARSALFDAFTQADSSTTRAHGGTGLGLAITRRLVEAMGGEIGLEVDGDQPGSTFWFTLPTEARALDARPAAPVARAVPLRGVSDRVLVVEDNPINQKLITRMLDKLGLSYDVAENGQVAVEAFDVLPYDLVLMDCSMPVMDGFQATRAIRRLEPAGTRTPIIAVTANVMPGDRERCLASGMDDYLPKPITIDGLSATIDRWFVARAAG